MSNDEKEMYLMFCEWKRLFSYNSTTKERRFFRWEAPNGRWLTTEEAFAFQKERDCGKIQW